MAHEMLARAARISFAPPRYLAPPAVGIDVSTSGIKIALLSERSHGIELVGYEEYPLPAGAFADGEIADHAAVVKGLAMLAKKHRIRTANIALPESRGYLFEADVAGEGRSEWCTAAESHIDEYVPLPPAEIAFDVAPVSRRGDLVRVAGIGYARRVVEETLRAFDDTGVGVRAMESETFAIARALLPHGSTETVLMIDIGKTTTKLAIVTGRLPRFATTLDIGGHALTLAVQKHFGVTEAEARKVKAEQGLIRGEGSEEYIAAMLSTVSAIREEILRRLDYWQTHAASQHEHEPVSRVLIAGGNATLLGLPEYLESALKVPVELGDVFTNLTPREYWLPPVDYMQSLAYATAIGLALREHVP